MTGEPFGPFRHDVGVVERVAQFRTLAVLAKVLHGDSPLWFLFRHAETDDGARAAALKAFDTLPALTRRRILATYAAVTWPKR